MTNRINLCFKCNKRVRKKIEECECKSRLFVCGKRNSFKFVDTEIIGLKNLVCNNCSLQLRRSSEFKDYANRKEYVYICPKCNNSVEITKYKDELDIMNDNTYYI